MKFTVQLFHYVLGTVVLILSGQAVYHAVHGGEFHGDLHMHKMLFAGFAAVEAVSALLFLIPSTMKIGGYGLLVILLGAFAFHGFHGEIELSLLVYAAGVILVLSHR